MKKKLKNILSIFLLLVLFMLSSNCYANWSQGEFEKYPKQCYISYDNAHNDDFYYNWFNAFISSGAYAQYKDSIPFDEYDSLLLRNGNGDTLTLLLFNSGTSLNVTSDGKISPLSGNITGWCIMFNCDRRYFSFTYNTTYDSYVWDSANNFYVYPNTSNFCLVFTTSTIVNQYNKVIYGYNYTINTPIYNGSVNVDVGQYYKLCSGFIGSYYYDNNNYQNLDFVILCNDTTEYTSLKNIYYTPTTNGNNVDIYIYVEPSMSQKGYKVITYYDNELMYNEPGYTTFIINGGSSSGDSGGGDGSIDLTDTNNLISGLTSAVISGDNKIINILESGEKKAEERDSFWRNTYNRLMTPSGEVLRDITTDLLLSLPFSSGDISGEIAVATAGLDIITDNAEDFVIKYDSFSPSFMGLSNKKLWESGEINFSKIEREVPAVKRVMVYVRGVLGFIFICALLHNAWRTLLMTLGINERLYTDEQEEIQKQASIEENWKSRRDFQNYNNWLWRNRKR